MRFHEDSSMSTASLLGRSFLYISMICWFESLRSGTFIITVGIKDKSFEAECDNLTQVHLLIYVSIKGITRH